jgi:hypothetical protein
MRKLRKLRAQSLSEYIIFLTVIILAAIVMQVYVRRGLQGRYAEVVDFATTKAGAFRQYEPGNQQEDFKVTQSTDAKEKIDLAGVINRTIVKDEVTRKGEIKEW